MVHFGSAGGNPAPVNPESLYDSSLKVSSYWLWTAHPDGEMASAAERLFSLVASGELRVEIAATLPLGEAAEAHRRLESGATRGKLLLHL